MMKLAGYRTKISGFCNYSPHNCTANKLLVNAFNCKTKGLVCLFKCTSTLPPISTLLPGCAMTFSCMVDGGSSSTERETWKPPTLMATVCHWPSLRAWPGRGRHGAMLRLKCCALIRANDWQIWGLCAGAQRVNLHMSARQRIHYSPWEGRAEI